MKHGIFGVLDFETDPFLAGRIPFPFACGIYFRDDSYVSIWNERDAIEQTVACLRRIRRDVDVYAHNGGRFDFFYLVEYADRGSIVVRNGRIVKMQIGRVTLRDSWPLMPFALEEYRKTKIDYRLFERNKRNIPHNRIRIQEYLYDDCRNLHELLTGFRAIVGPSETIGSAAFYQMRKCGIEIPALTESHDEVFRQFFYGGRVQAFAKGVFHGRYEYLDVNSAYPYAMLQRHPSGMDYSHSRRLPSKESAKGACFVSLEATSKGAFPARADDGSLEFPIARGIYHVTGWELIAGLETRTVKVHEILDVWVPRNTITFSDFVLPFYEMRLNAKKSGDRISYLAYKYLLNSGYGKFAQNPRDFREYVLVPFGEIPDGKDWEWETDYGGISLWSRPTYDGRGFYDVATGASITGFQRAILWRGIQASRDVLYCDTDAILCRNSRVPKSDKLGQWKVEGITRECAIAGKKLYGLKFADSREEKLSSKGARLTYSEIKSLCRGKIVHWRKDAPTFSATTGASFIERDITST